MATEPSPKPKILVRFDRVYGKIACYPASPAAECIAALARKKTLDRRDVELARDLGFDVGLKYGAQEVLDAFMAGKLEGVTL